MSEEPTRPETDELLEFIERTLPLLESGLLAAKKIATEEIVAETIMEYGDFAHRRPSMLRNIPEAVSSALRGDQGGISAIVVLVHNIIGGAFVFNAVANLAILAITGDEKISDDIKMLRDGIKKLGDVFAGNLPESVRTMWYLSLYDAMFYSLELSLSPRVAEHFKEMAKFPAYHCVNILNSLLLDSAIRRATLSQSFDLLKSLYEFFIDDKTKISREVSEIVSDMKRYNSQFVFMTTRVEPRVLFLSWLLKYCWMKKFVPKPIVPDDPTSDYVLNIEPADELIQEVWKSWKSVAESRIDRNFIKKRVSILAKYKAPIMPDDPDYLDFKNAGPYVYFFSSLDSSPEGAGEGSSKGVKLGRPFQKEALTNIAVPFLSCIYPFIGVSIIDKGPFISIRGRTEKETVRLLRALAYGSHFSATYAVRLLSGVHALKLLESGRSRSGLDEVFEKLRTANYGPFLPPDVMIRHSPLVIDSMLFKETNALLRKAGRYDLVFEPSGNFEEDLRKLWEMLPPEGRMLLKSWHGVKDVDELLKLVERESYELFMRVQTTPLEVCSAYLTKAYLTKRVR
jgi:hypothetical protein